MTRTIDLDPNTLSWNVPEEEAILSKILRLSFLVGDPGRTDEEDQTMRDLFAELALLGFVPGWTPVAINPELQRW